MEANRAQFLLAPLSCPQAACSKLWVWWMDAWKQIHQPQLTSLTPSCLWCPHSAWPPSNMRLTTTAFWEATLVNLGTHSVVMSTFWPYTFLNLDGKHGWLRKPEHSLKKYSIYRAESFSFRSVWICHQSGQSVLTFLTAARRKVSEMSDLNNPSSLETLPSTCPCLWTRNIYIHI